MFRRYVFPEILAAVADYFRRNPKQDTPENRGRFEKRVRNRSGGWAYPSSQNVNGREAERRRRQIEAGQLRHENGLVRPGQMEQHGSTITIRKIGGKW